MATKDWNTAYVGNEDWKAAMSSEIFRNYLQIVTAQEETQEETIEAEVVDKPEVPEVKPMVAETDDVDYGELYNTGAGDSEYIDIGMSHETEKLMEDGIDYCCNEIENSDVETSSDDVAEIGPTNNDEIREAEVALGLDTNIFYLMQKLGK